MKMEEKILFFWCWNIKQNPYFNLSVREIVNVVRSKYGIPIKRCWYYLRKWAELGFYDYGVTLDLGWFEIDKLPERYVKVLKDVKGED